VSFRRYQETQGTLLVRPVCAWYREFPCWCDGNISVISTY